MAMLHGGNVWEGGEPDSWLDFSANLRPEGTPEWVRQAMLGALANARYYPDRAMTAARRGLAAYADVPEECVLPTAGGAAAIDLVLSLAKGDVLLTEPTFGEYRARAALHGRKVRPWPDDARKGDLIIQCNPNNPTGQCRGADELLALHQSLTTRGAELMVDEAFIDYCPECSIRKAVQPGLTVVGSLTKILCIPGVRLGYVCAAPEVIARLEKLALPWSLNMLAVAVAEKLPEHTEDIAADAARNIRRREQLTALLTQRGVEVLPSRANFLLIKWPGDADALARRLKGKGILVRTCESFGLPKDHLRLAVRTEEDNQRLVDAMFD